MQECEYGARFLSSINGSVKKYSLLSLTCSNVLHVLYWSSPVAWYIQPQQQSVLHPSTEKNVIKARFLWCDICVRDWVIFRP